MYGYFLDGAFDVQTLVNGATRGIRWAPDYPVQFAKMKQGVVIGEAILDDMKELFNRYAMKAKFLSTPYMNKAIDNKAYEKADGEKANMQTRWYARYFAFERRGECDKRLGVGVCVHSSRMVLHGISHSVVLHRQSWNV